MSKTELNFINSQDVDIEKVTPVMQQYLNIKKDYNLENERVIVRRDSHYTHDNL